MTATSSPPARIVIIGGGTGGTVTANRLAEKLHSEIDAGEADITLVTDGPQHVYKPMWLYVAFNRKDVEESYRPHREVLDDRVNLAIDRVTDIEPDAHQIQTADRTEPIEYDRLVVATGATIEEPRIEGFDEHGQHFYTADGALELKERLAGFEGGELVLSTIGVPHMCPAAPVEFVLIADEWLSRRGLREDTEITYTYPIHAAHEVRTLADWIEPTFEARDITLKTAFEVEAVDADTLYAADGRTLEHDLLVGIPPHAGSDLVRESSLGEEWIDVDNRTLEVRGANDIYALGDATNVPTSKAGSAAHYQAGVVADRLASEVRGELPTARYDGKTLCFVEAGLDEATYIEFDYDSDPVVRDPSGIVHYAKLGYNESYWLTARGLL